MNTKHAYLVIAHNNICILNCLLEMIDDSRNDIYLLIDKKSSLNHAKIYSCKQSRLFRLKPVINILWGNFSQIEAELYLMKEAHKQGRYAYYHLLSGSDLPLHTQDEIHLFFSKHHGKEFIGFAQGKQNKHDCYRKVMQYHFFPHYQRERYFKKVLLYILNKISGICINSIKKREEDIQFKKGCNWFSITDECCKYILSKEKFIRERFRYTLCADEIFLQSLVFNSDFYRKCFNISSEYEGCMREIDWKRGKPYTWTIHDREELDKSQKLFARKFSDSQIEIALFLKEKIIQKTDTQRKLPLDQC